MTINRSEVEIIHEIASVKSELITDAYVLDLHVRHITAAGQLPASVKGRRGAILRLTDWLDPYAEQPRAVLNATTDRLAEWQASKAHLSAKTMSIYVNHVQMYYRWLVRPMRILKESPAEDLIPPIVRRRKPRPIPENDLTFALTAARHDKALFAWLVLMSYCGCRSVDIEGIEREDVLAGDEVPMLRLRGKGGHEDLIPIGEEVLRALDPFLRRRRGPLFVGKDDRRVDRRTIRERTNWFLQRIGLPYTAHNLRHRYGTHVYDLTRDLRYTQHLMRHRSAASTEVYVAVPTGQDVETMRKLDARLAKHTTVPVQPVDEPPISEIEPLPLPPRPAPELEPLSLSMPEEKPARPAAPPPVFPNFSG